VDIPEEIHAAAKTLHIYFEVHGMQEWEFSYLADRRLVTKLERERDAMKQVVDAARCIRHWHDREPDGMVVSADKVRSLWTALHNLDSVKSD
jgi:hypothetical protein